MIQSAGYVRKITGAVIRPSTALNLREDVSFYRVSPSREKPMFDQRKKELLAAWRKLATQSQLRMDPEEQYDELLKAADEMEEQGLITSAEWRQLVRDAGSVFRGDADQTPG